ncbi:MAG: SDR family oxidoreductase [Symbiobacterium sp.]|jgi:short chain dehydrogenase.|uniref:SDR family oxidoreductase n=1 Tax=Symbiobacterium sp. TaxID=1971213 RepID=UPI0034647938
MREFPKEVVAITGAGGMGLAIARRLGPGRRVVIADYSEEVLTQAEAHLKGEGHDVHAVRTDVSDPKSVRALAETVERLGKFRYLVHTAGVSPVQAPPERVVAVDVVGTALVLDEFYRLAGPGTVAVCIASMAGAMAPLPPEVEWQLATTPTAQLASLPVLDPSQLDRGAAYSIAKRANQLRVQWASLAWGRKGARVVSVSPGLISTPMGQQELSGPSGEAIRSMIAASGTGRVGTPDDIAAVVEFLVSPAASFITGTDLLVDGGAVAGVRYARAGQEHRMVGDD